MNERDTLKINSRGHLEIGGMDTTDITVKFGTPLYVFDERHIRDMMSVYRETIAKEYEGNGLVLYASKAFSCTAIYAIAKQENIDVTEEEFNAQIEKLASGYGMPGEKMKEFLSEDDKESIRRNISVEKAIAIVMEHAQEVEKEDTEDGKEKEDNKE